MARNEFKMRKEIEAILKNYQSALQTHPNVNSKHPAVVALKEFEKELSKKFVNESNALIAKAGYGAGNWTKVPWLALLDKRVTIGASKGIYLVLLFKADMTGFYLSLSKASESLHGTLSARLRQELKTNAERIRQSLTSSVPREFFDGPPINLEVLEGPGVGFEAGAIFHKFYPSDELPSDVDLTKDIKALLKVYELGIENGTIPKDNTVPPVGLSPIVPLSELSAETISQWLKSSDECGVRCKPELLLRTLAACLSKRFLILGGLSGSGKTKLAQSLAHWITPRPNAINLESDSSKHSLNPHFALVPVGADWTGNENILGYPDGLQPAHYVSKAALDLILHAVEHRDVPHFLILDEMNLSHVERYFADVLSIIESDEGLELYSGDIEKPGTWRKTSAGKPVPPKLKQLPENLFIIGTVNVDETTYMFSPKVLDRANVIEFRMHPLELEEFLSNPTKPNLLKLDGNGALFGKSFVDASKNPVAVPEDMKAKFDAEMLLFFKSSQVHGAEFGYRTAYESARFIHFYKLLSGHADGDTTWFPVAFDCVIIQKLLPKLHGSRAKLGPVLKTLWYLCVNDPESRGSDPLEAAGESKTEPHLNIPAHAPYPMSAEKINRMWRMMMDNGFASFAEA